MTYIYVICTKQKKSIREIVSELENIYNLRATKTYTTKPRAYQKESGYVFVNDEIFDETEFASSVQIDGYKYGITKSEIDACDIFPCEAELAIEFINKYLGKKLVKVIYVWDWGVSMEPDEVDLTFPTLNGAGDLVICLHNELCADRIYDFICENERINREVF